MPLDPDIKKNLDAAVKDARNCGIVQGAQKTLSMLASYGLMRSQIIEPTLVGVHPSNRDGLGVVPHACHQLLEDIVSVGWDSRQCDAICVDVPPSNPAVFQFNKELHDSSNGQLPAMDPLKLKYCSLSCSHTNMALRCILAGVEHVYENSMLAVQGRLQLEQVRLKDAAMASACENGLTWRVINSEAMECDGLADLIQAACNTSAQLSRGESEIQILRRVLNMINNHGHSGQLQFSTVKEAILRTKPACSESIPEMFTFLVRHGAAAHLQTKLSKTEARMKSAKVDSRMLGRDFYHALGQDPKDTKQDGLVNMRHAVLAFAYCSQHHKSVTLQDVRKIASKDKVAHGKLLRGQVMMEKMHVKFEGIDWKSFEKKHVDACVDALHSFDDSIVLWSLDKRIGPKSLEHAACSLVDSVDNIIGVRLTKDFDAFKTPLPSSGSTQTPTGAVNLDWASVNCSCFFCWVFIGPWDSCFFPAPLETCQGFENLVQMGNWSRKSKSWMSLVLKLACWSCVKVTKSRGRSLPCQETRSRWRFLMVPSPALRK